MTAGAVLAIDGLHLEIGQHHGATPILRGVDLHVAAGSIHGVVGESGAGKTMVAKAIMGLLPEGARVTGGDIRFDAQSLLTMGEGQRRSLLGRSISMIMQNPMTALNPVVRIGKQMTAVLRRHLQLDAEAATQRALAALSAVRIRHPERVLRLYPHELSGGMCQRVLVSLAFASEPSLIIADEPTTALDVTVQRQVLQILKELQARTGVAVVFITHDLGVVAKLCDSASVMFAGRVVETAAVERLFAQPRHDYTKALFAATPRYDRPAAALRPVPTALRDRLLDEARSYDRARSDV
jgi:peptide/nickel transport system ATP-binding protein